MFLATGMSAVASRPKTNGICSADRDVFAFDWLGMGASARPSFRAPDQDAAESFFLQVR
jgi:hypothetical protein